MGQFSKKFEDLQFSDNYIFCKVMHNKELCKEMLEILLGIKVKDIEYIETEHPIENFYENRGIRMDVFVQNSDKIFNMEMQTGDYDDLLMRSRYYLSAADTSTTPRRTRFKDLKETYILFICKDDPFNHDIPLYTEQKVFKELPEVQIDDKSHKLFYNCSAFAKAEDEEVASVLEFIYDLKAKSKFTKKLEDEVIHAKARPGFKDDYMYFMDYVEYEAEKAAEKAAKEAAEKAAKEATEKATRETTERVTRETTEKFSIEAATALLKEGLSVELIAKCINIPISQVRELAEQLEKQEN